MKISKLTITPLSKGWTQTVIVSPSAERAGTLIKDRLNSGVNDTTQRLPRIYRKIPKFLKGFVNPDSKVIDKNKFSAEV